MTKMKRLSEAADTNSPELAGAIANLAQEIRVLRDSIDDFRSAVRWGLQNNRFKSDGEPSVQNQIVNTDEVVEAVQQSLSEVGDELNEVVREGLKEGFADFKDTVDQFSIDVEFAVRKIGEHVAAAERYRQGCLFFDDR
jgi:ABC-type transporter Mla subunit MlaD